jgi:hypothetical protein
LRRPPLFDYLRKRSWGIRLLAAFVLLTWPILLVINVVATAYDEGVFDDLGGQLKDVAKSLKTGRI